MTDRETEYVEVPLKEQLDHDDDGSDDTNAVTDGDADDRDLDDYRDTAGQVWDGK